MAGVEVILCVSLQILFTFLVFIFCVVFRVTRPRVCKAVVSGIIRSRRQMFHGGAEVGMRVFCDKPRQGSVGKRGFQGAGWEKLVRLGF